MKDDLLPPETTSKKDNSIELSKSLKRSEWLSKVFLLILGNREGVTVHSVSLRLAKHPAQIFQLFARLISFGVVIKKGRTPYHIINPICEKSMLDDLKADAIKSLKE